MLREIKVTMPQNAEKKKLKELLSLQGNTTCADCSRKKPTWASINIGIFLCLNCAGIHRELGTHISKVRSVDLDTWQPEWIENVRRIGNLKSNLKYEATLTPNTKPTEDESQMLGLKLRKFIRAKYEKKAFFKTNVSQERVFIKAKSTASPVPNTLSTENITENLLDLDFDFKPEPERKKPIQSQKKLVKPKCVEKSTERSTIKTTQSYDDKAAKILELFSST